MRRSSSFRSLLAAAAAAAALGLPLMAQTASNETQAAAPRAQDVRYVVIHRPGPLWRHGSAFLEQPGIHEHIDHYRVLRRAGKLFLGGPFTDAAGGGMMVPAAALPEAEIRAFAAADPAVKSGLLLFEVRPWLLAMAP